MHTPHFIRRFGYLLWKNILWKVRNWAGTLLEIFFPTFLFILLIILKYQNPVEDKPITQPAAKAMPSAGLIPFMQTVYCDLDNRFNNRPDGLPDFKGSQVDSLYDQLAEVFNRTDGILTNSDTFQNTLQQVSQLLGFGNYAPDNVGGGGDGPTASSDLNELNEELTQLCSSIKDGSVPLQQTLGLDSVCSDNSTGK
eukprot:TRINITY_DN2363_c0_g1_i4.p1 TRINITY_DN2363_c0_g1~~TRINITY_DN2363_c0_g1_i4.p1  ORF type:complete len:196 (-),score=27.05 TRINITY_DN2363_c0_g1_i4:60-647(-)